MWVEGYPSLTREIYKSSRSQDPMAGRLLGAIGAYLRAIGDIVACCGLELPIGGLGLEGVSY